MSRILLAFLAFSATLAIATCLNFDRTLPPRVNSIQRECEIRYHLGECVNLYKIGIWPRCDKFACATGPSRELKRRSVLIGKAPNGLGCGPRNRICYEGVCDALRPGERWPLQGITDLTKVFSCFKRNDS